MKALTVEEASQNLGRWVQRAIGGEQIAIHEGASVVLLQPLATPANAPRSDQLSPREALRLLQQESSVTSKQAEEYMLEVRAERLASEAKRTA
jgi:antitoxin (DNA-binding transcriptional repressor) of toxin-antitoxin stability system